MSSERYLTGRVSAHGGIWIGDAGGLSDHVIVKEKHAIRLPDSVSLEIAGEISLPTCHLTKH